MVTVENNDRVTALAYDPDGNTSEFARNVKVEGFSVGVHSPVTIRLVDPNGRVVDIETNEIPGAVYDDVTDTDGDGEPDDYIILPAQVSGTYDISVLPEPDAEPGDTYSLLIITGSDTTHVAEDVPVPEPGETDEYSYEPVMELPNYMCGDANADEAINIADAVHLINYIFKGGPAPEPPCVGDASGDGAVNIGDAVHLINYIFKGGPAPVEDCCL